MVRIALTIGVSRLSRYRKGKVMKIAVEGKEYDATVAEYRCRQFVSATFFINGVQVGPAETAGQRYKIVHASPREREILKCWGYRIEGL